MKRAALGTLLCLAATVAPAEVAEQSFATITQADIEARRSRAEADASKITQLNRDAVRGITHLGDTVLTARDLGIAFGDRD